MFICCQFNRTHSAGGQRKPDQVPAGVSFLALFKCKAKRFLVYFQFSSTGKAGTAEAGVAAPPPIFQKRWQPPPQLSKKRLMFKNTSILSPYRQAFQLPI